MTGTDRVCYNDFYQRVKEYDFITPHLISYGNPLSVGQALETLKDGGGHGAADPVEGAVWRVERNGKVDFLTKYVQHGKEDGKYFSEITGKDAVWNVNINHWK